MGTIHGVTLIEPRWIDNARCIGLKGWRLVQKVIMPAAMPSIFAGASMALIFGFILLTVAEMFGAKSGLGYFIQYHADFADYPKVIIGMVFLSVVIIATMAAFDRWKLACSTGRRTDGSTETPMADALKEKVKQLGLDLGADLIGVAFREGLE